MAQYVRTAGRCGGCVEYRYDFTDTDRGVALGHCHVRTVTASVADDDPICSEYRPAPGVPTDTPVEAPPARASDARGSGEARQGMARDTFRAIVREALADVMGLQPVAIAPRWKGGTLVLRPGKPGLQSKEVPIDSFFNKIIMIRDRLRVLEAKINAHPALSHTDKIELQQYITRCYGSLTTFNILLADERDRFRGESRRR